LVRLASTDDLQAYHELGQWNFLLTARPAADVRRIARSARLASWTASNRIIAR
jgi:hypothetical protein